MNLSDVKKAPLSRKHRMRVGRGSASGKGGTSGKGNKGQNARSGVSFPSVFEGGTMPLYRRIPRRGFSNTRFREDWVCINVDDLNKLPEGSEVDLAILAEQNIVKAPKSRKNRLKVLGYGELKVKGLKLKAHKVSKIAKEKLEKAQASIEVIKIVKFKRARLKKTKKT